MEQSSASNPPLDELLERTLEHELLLRRRAKDDEDLLESSEFDRRLDDDPVEHRGWIVDDVSDATDRNFRHVACAQPACEDAVTNPYLFGFGDVLQQKVLKAIPENNTFLPGRLKTCTDADVSVEQGLDKCVVGAGSDHGANEPSIGHYRHPNLHAIAATTIEREELPRSEDRLPDN